MMYGRLDWGMRFVERSYNPLGAVLQVVSSGLLNYSALHFRHSSLLTYFEEVTLTMTASFSTFASEWLAIRTIQYLRCMYDSGLSHSGIANLLP